MKIKFNTDDNLPLNKPLKLHLLTIIVRCIFEEDGKFYPQLYLDDCLYELIFQEELMLIKRVHQKNVIFVIIGILKIFFLGTNHIFAMAVMI